MTRQQISAFSMVQYNMVLHFVDRGLAAGKGTVYDVLANDDPGAD